MYNLVFAAAAADGAAENEPRVPRRAVAVESGPGGRRRGARQRLHAAMVPDDSGTSYSVLCDKQHDISPFL